MSKMKIFLFFGLWILILSSCGGNQNPTVRNVVKKKIVNNVAIGVENFSKGKLDSSLLFLKEALRSAYSIDDVVQQENVLINLAEINIGAGMYEEASNHIFKAKEMSEREHITTYDFSLFLVIGKYFDRTENFDEALNFYQQALKIAENGSEKARVLNSMGILYRKMKKFDKAIKYLGDARNSNLFSKDYLQLANNDYNIGEIRFAQKKYKQALKKYQSALKNDKIAENSSGIFDDLKKIATCYYKLSDIQNALYFLGRAEKVANSVKMSDSFAEIQALRKEWGGDLPMPFKEKSK